MTDSIKRERSSRWGMRLLYATALLLIAIAVIGPEVRDPVRMLLVDYEIRSQPPSAAYPLGTDAAGRDNVARLADALRATLVFATAAALLWGGLCCAAGLLGRPLRRLSRNPVFLVGVDAAVVGFASAVGLWLWLDWLDPDRGLFQVAGATASPGVERLITVLTLYESSMVLFIAIGLAMGVWISRTVLSRGLVMRVMPVVLSALGLLAIRAEPFLSAIGIKGVEPPSSTLGTMIRFGANDTLEWWAWLPLTLLWSTIVLELMAIAWVSGVQHIPKPASLIHRAPIYVAVSAWIVYLTTVVVDLAPRTLAEWSYWTSVGMAVLGAVWCAARVARSPSELPGRTMYVIALACALPLALDWPISQALNFAIPRVF